MLAHKSALRAASARTRPAARTCVVVRFTVTPGAVRDITEDAGMVKEWETSSQTLASVDDLNAYYAEHPYTRPSEKEDLSPDMSGEWPMAWSLATMQDLEHYYRSHGQQANDMINEPSSKASLRLREVMSTDLEIITPDVPVDAIRSKLSEKGVSGLPVVDKGNRLVGVVSRRDIEDKQGDKAADVMTSPPIAAKPDARVKDAAVLMLKHKVHRIPVVDKDAQVVGMVTRHDIFQAMEKESA